MPKSRSYFSAYLSSLIVFYLFALTPAQVQAQAAKTVKKAAIGFVLSKSQKKGNSALKYCVLSKKWLAASAFKIKDGKATIFNSKAAEKICKSLGKAFSAASITYKKGVSGAALGAASTSSSFVRVGTSGSVYPIVYGLGAGSAETAFVLPSNYSIIEIASAPQTIAGASCYYAIISPSGTLSCLSTLRSVSGTSSFSVYGGRAFQSDASKNSFFVGSGEETANRALYKLSAAGSLSVAYSAAALATISGFKLLSDGRVLISLSQANSSDPLGAGYDVAPQVVLLESDGTARTLSSDTRTISGKGHNWLGEFIDGRGYIGLTNYSGAGSLASTTAQIHRVTATLDGLEHYLTPASDALCSGESSGPVCAYGASIIRAVASSSDATYVIAQEPLSGPLSSAVVRLFPTLGVLLFTNLSNPSGMANLGSSFVIAGKNGSGQGVLIGYNTDTLVETVLKSGILIGDGPYYVERSKSFVAYGTDLSVPPPKLYALEIPVSSTGVLGTLRQTAISAGSSLSFAY